MCLRWSPCLAPSFTNPITCPLRASSITCQLYYVPITCQAHVIELARNRVRSITCPLRARLLRNLCETYYVHVIGPLRAYYVTHVTRYVVFPRNSLYYVHVIDLVWLRDSEVALLGDSKHSERPRRGPGPAPATSWGRSALDRPVYLVSF